MRLPRDLSGIELAKLLSQFGYYIDRQTGSHIRLTVEESINKEQRDDPGQEEIL